MGPGKQRSCRCFAVLLRPEKPQLFWQTFNSTSPCCLSAGRPGPSF